MFKIDEINKYNIYFIIIQCGEFTVLGGPYDYEVSPNFRLHLENLPSHSHLKVEFKAWLIDGSTSNIIKIKMYIYFN